MKRFLHEYAIPAAYVAFGSDLTIPPLDDVLSPRVVADQTETRAIWNRFQVSMRRAGTCFVWRLELQTRANTKKDHLRGKPQPHFHTIGGLPSDMAPDDVRELWLAALMDRGKVPGAKFHAATVRLCADYAAYRMRYLVDHTSKRKAEQIAHGWGRHWGVVGRDKYTEQTETETLQGSTFSERIQFRRYLSKLLARRVPDHRATGGVPYQIVEVSETHVGYKVAWIGGFEHEPAWDGSWPWPADLRRKVAQSLGKNRVGNKRNIWALRRAKVRGYHSIIYGPEIAQRIEQAIRNPKPGNMDLPN